jgi:DMSO reductase family type II enzyme heme b subunit
VGGEGDLRADGAWNAGRWRVVLTRALGGPDGVKGLFPGKRTFAAFAVWDGASGDRNGQKSISSWIPLEVAK